MTLPHPTTPPSPIVPPFTLDTALAKVQAAEDGWNSKDPARVSMAYTPDSQWRNRDQFINGRDQIVEFLTHKWATELEYRLRKKLWAFQDNRIAVRFEYEYHNADGQWFRAYGNENWAFDSAGLMCQRFASINDQPIDERQLRVVPGQSEIA